MRLNAAPMAAASVPASGGRAASKRPACIWFSACTICPNGRTARPTSQNTAVFTSSSNTRAPSTSTTT